ncbi:DUF2516 family protein [Streptomyces sp. NPDC005438]|uniref:DUF2516 family protein n=1 Tax=Streptomyces sp. NPDC005438 TaxID=3156880 RepID=UPI0033A47221
MESPLIQNVYSLFGWLVLAMFLFAVFCFVDALIRREDAFRATDKQTKVFWLIMLGVVMVVHLLPLGLFFLQIAGLIANIVYMVDVRPAVREVSRGRGSGGWGRRGGSSSDGPYGPFNGR